MVPLIISYVYPIIFYCFSFAHLTFYLFLNKIYDVNLSENIHTNNKK